MTKDNKKQTALWEGPIGFEDERTGDGRFIVHEALTWTATDEDPLPLRFVSKDVGAHDGAEAAGRILSVERRDGGVIWGKGDFDLGSDIGWEAYRQVAEKLTRGVSMDLDDVSWELEVDDEAETETTLTHEARIRAATLVGIPAFAGALINVTKHPESVEAEVEAEGGGDAEAEELGSSLPEGVFEEIVDEMTSELGDSSKLAEDGEEIKVPKGAETVGVVAFIPSDDSPISGLADDAHITAAFLGELSDLSQEQIDGIRNEVASYAAALVPFSVEAIEQGPLGPEGADVVFLNASDELAGLQTALVDSKTLVGAVVDSVEQYPVWTPHITLNYPETDEDKIEYDLKAPITIDRIGLWLGNGSHEEFALGALVEVTADAEEEELAALVAAAAPIDPPAAWFMDPKLSGPTPLTITDDGQIYGHLAVWDSCHTANPMGYGQCTAPPSSNTGYSRFHTGTLKTAEGRIISTGKITMSTGHAGPKASPKSTLAHYDNTGTAAADVRVGEDVFGIWFAGAVRPNVSDDKRRVLRASPISGDWREVDRNLELHAALAVNVPGFQIPHPQGLVASGEMVSLIASGIVVTEETAERAEAELSRQVDLPEELRDLSAEDVQFLKGLVAESRSALTAQRRQKVNTFANRRKVNQFVANRSKS